ncbi:MAG: hypothetical protein ABFR50_03040, partial [Candidatus Fermentibacteria bacterium]
MITETEEMGMIEFNLDGEPCYRIEADAAPGIGTVEYGVLNGTLMIAGGWTLRDLVNGTDFEEYTAEHGMNIGPDHGLVFISDMEMINDALGFSADTRDSGNRVSSTLNRLSASLDADNGLFELTVILETAVSNPFPVATEMLTAIVMDMLGNSLR